MRGVMNEGYESETGKSAKQETERNLSIRLGE